jgi:hypothetical protein
MSVHIDARIPPVVTAAGLVIQSSEDHAEFKLLFHQIHSAAPFCGIDPSQRQRVDSKYQLQAALFRVFTSPKFHLISRPRSHRYDLLVDKKIPGTRGENTEELGVLR